MLQQAPARHQRPKPPGSRNRLFQLEHTSSGPFHSSVTQDKRRSMDLSMRDEQEVDIELSHPSPGLRKSTSMKNIGLGLPSAFTLSGFNNNASGQDTKGPSPPPAYGPLLPDRDGAVLDTPPTQDVEHPSNTYFSKVNPAAQDLQSRQRRATDAAEAIGLQLSFSPDRHMSDDIDGLGEVEIRDQLRIMKRQLDLRDNEINMTASIAQKMLQRHEELVSALPADIKALIPRLNDFAGLDITVGGGRTRETIGFSAASNDLRSPGPSIALGSPGVPSPDMSENHEMTDLPRRYQTTSQANRESFAEIQQQEAEDRLAAMEQALTEARESEEAQRKAAARLRKDFEKLQRDYERAEAQAIEENLCESVSSPAKIPGKRIIRRETIQDKEDGKIGLGWGIFTFPEFPTEPGPSNWQSPQKQAQSPYTAKPPRPMEGYLRRRRERMSRAGDEDESLSEKVETISGLPPASTTPSRHGSRKGLSPPTIKYLRSPVYRMDVTHHGSDTTPPPSPTRHLRSLAPSPISGHLDSYMRNFADGQSVPIRSLGSEIRGAAPMLRHISSAEDIKVTERAADSGHGEEIGNVDCLFEPSVRPIHKPDEAEDEEDLAILAEISRGRSPRSSLRKRRSYRLLTLPRSHGLEMPDPPSPLRLAQLPKTSRPVSSHRRRVSSPGRELREQIELRRKEEQQRGHGKEDSESDDSLSVPSRIINDAIILLGLLTEWLEVSLVIVYRVFVEARNGRRPNGAKSLWVGRKRYYL